MLLQMRLVVFVKKTLVSAHSERQGWLKGDGFGKSRRKQGGIVVHIELDNGETIAFVSCHLAAHEKPKFLQARNDMVPEIFNGAWRLSTATGGRAPHCQGHQRDVFRHRKRSVQKV